MLCYTPGDLYAKEFSTFPIFFTRENFVRVGFCPGWFGEILSGGILSRGILSWIGDKHTLQGGL